MIQWIDYYGNSIRTHEDSIFAKFWYLLSAWWIAYVVKVGEVLFWH